MMKPFAFTYPAVTVLMNLTRVDESEREVLCFYGSCNRKPRTASKILCEFGQKHRGQNCRHEAIFDGTRTKKMSHYVTYVLVKLKIFGVSGAD